MSNESFDALARALIKMSQLQNSINNRVKAGYERFGLVRVKHSIPTKNHVSIIDLFNEQTRLELVTHDFDNTKDDEILLIADNGTQFNIDKKIGKEWESWIGFGLLTDSYSLWERFVGNCNHLDFTLDQVWGHSKDGKWVGSHAKMLVKIEKKLIKTFAIQKKSSVSQESKD